MSQIRNVALGVAVRDGHLLVIDELDSVRGQRFHRLVGGGIEFGETSEQALRREFHEELGADLRSAESLGVLENIFEYEGEPGHQIAHLYLVESDAIDSLALDETRKVADEDAWAHWVDLSALDLPLYPDGAEEIIASVLAARESDVEQFWARARGFLGADAQATAPSSWAFGATAKHADELLELVLAGTKTGTAGPLAEYEAEGEHIPFVGELSVVLDGRGRPRALIETTDVQTVPFDRVSEEHAWSEGEGDHTLAAWREIHERFWRTYPVPGREFSYQMPVVCERFRLLYSEP